MPDAIFLSKFTPLPRIFFADDFDEGVNGWCELIGNHDGDLNKVRKVMEDLRPPQLSSANFFDIGSHGSLSGTYSLKLATRAKAGHMAQTIKRTTSRSDGRVRVECYFTYKAEQIFGADTQWDGNVDPSERNFGDFTISNDICEGDDGRRYHIALRYLNTDKTGALVQRWMYKTSVQPSTKMVMSKMVRPNYDYHVVNEDDWLPVPNGHQPFCYNEIPTKINWHYLRWDFDTRTRRSVELQVNNLLMPLQDIPVPVYDHPYKALNRLMNFCFDVRTHRPVRNFLFLDSVVVSFE